MTAKTGIGQDSHAFEEAPGKPLILAGIKLDHPIGLKGNSDADVVLHSITNAISSITGSNILGSVADHLCQEGVTDSSNFIKLALDDLEDWDSPPPPPKSGREVKFIQCRFAYALVIPTERSLKTILVTSSVSNRSSYA